MRWAIVCLVTLSMTAAQSTAQEQITITTPASTEHEMILIPAGPFLMGSDDNAGYVQEQPQHTVFLDAFHIDKYEVTIARYRACVDAGACDPPLSEGEGYLWNKSGFDDHPVNGATWANSDAYCRWADMRLPSEAEWEKAARGTDGRVYPWGDEFDDTRITLGGPHPLPVGSHPTGVSPYGVHDMAGSVWEFVADWYIEDFYYRNSLFNPVWPYEGENRIVRGGSGHSGPPVVRTTYRHPGSATSSSAWAGFRCARSSEGETFARFQSAALSANAAVANRPIPVKTEVQLDRPMEDNKRFQNMLLDFSAAGSDVIMPLESAGSGRYTGQVVLPSVRSGHHPLQLLAETDDGQRHLVCRLFLDVVPDVDVEIYGDELSEQWALNPFKVEQVELAQTDAIYSGNAASSFRVESSFSGWQIALVAPEPMDPYGYVLRFAFHPGDATTKKGTRLVANFSPGGALNLLPDHIDLERREWQVVEVAMTDIEMDGPLENITLAGNFGGTFYLDDLRLAAPEPPPITAVLEERQQAIPAAFALAQNFPNPFNSSTVIRFALPQPEEVELALFNLAGQKVATLVQGARQAGVYAVNWDGRNSTGLPLASGVYLYQLLAGNRAQTHKLLLLR